SGFAAHFFAVSENCRRAHHAVFPRRRNLLEDRQVDAISRTAAGTSAGLLDEEHLQVTQSTQTRPHLAIADSKVIAQRLDAWKHATAVIEIGRASCRERV